MDDLNALFDSVDGLKEDLIEYGTIAGAAVGANVVWNYLVARFVPTTTDATVRKFGLPALAIVGGIFAGRAVAKHSNRRIGLGVTIGLVSAGLTSLVKAYLPSLPLAGESYGGYGGYLEGAPVVAEDLGGAMTVEDFRGVDGGGFASAMT